MIRIEDFETYKDFKKFIINYLKEENILEKFKYNLKEDNTFYRKIDSYIRYIYTNRELDKFFYRSFNWGFSDEGAAFWRDVDIKYCQYLKDGFILQQYWDD